MLAEQPRRRFTADEVARMVEAGILAEDEHLELLDGELFAMSPQGPRHRATTVRLHRRLAEAFGPAFHVQDHSPIAAGPDSLPEPDVAVVRGSEADFADRHPSGADVALVVEVSVTSHALDRAKASVYARAGVAEYWQLDAPGRRLWVSTEPRGGEYRVVRLLRDDEGVPVAGGSVRVADLLVGG